VDRARRRRSPRRPSNYYSFFIHSFARGRKALYMVKPDLEMPDEDVTVDDEISHFGTLLMAGHDWDRPALWRRSMALLATEVMPRLRRHAEATPAG
jgi:hypothetical protein